MLTDTALRNLRPQAKPYKVSRSSRGVYNKAEYETQRRHMLQEWANMLDAWVDGRKYKPVVVPPALEIGPLEATV